MLLSTLKKDDAPGVYRDFYHWLSVASPELGRGGFSAIISEQPSFERSLHELDEVLAVPKQLFDKTGFTVELKKFREVLMKQNEKKEQGLPSDINPIA